MTASAIHTEHAAGVAKPEQASSPSFGSVLADVKAERQSNRAASAPVHGGSPAAASSPDRQPAAAAKQAAKQSTESPAGRPSTGSEAQKPAVQSGNAESSSARPAARESKSPTATSSNQQQAVLAGAAEVSQPAAVPVWTVPVTVQPSVGSDSGASDNSATSRDGGSAGAATAARETAQPGEAQWRHPGASVSGGFQGAIALLAGDPMLNAAGTDGAETAALPESSSGKPGSDQGAAAAQPTGNSPEASGAGAPTSALSGKVTVSGTNHAPVVKSDAGAGNAEAGKQSTSASAAAPSASGDAATTPAANGNATPAHTQVSSVTVTAAPARSMDGSAAPLTTMQAAPRDTAQPASATERSEVRQAADTQAADPLTQLGNAGMGSGINTSKLIQTMSETEMRVGLRSNDFGEISIRTLVSQQQMQAQISVDHGDLGRAIAAHLPLVQTRLANDHGLKAMIEVSQSGMSFSGERGSTPQREQRSVSRNNSINPVTNDSESMATRLMPAAGDADRLSIRA